nr:unnamed protein product [Spirometra erinaceieuropaei]
MHFYTLTILNLLITSVWADIAAYPVIELSSESSADLHSGLWLLKFYAPWCSFCHHFEPVYREVGRTLSRILPEVRVGRIDAPANPSLSADFGIRGYPTIIFLNNGRRYQYYGERTAEDLVKFVIRASGPAVKKLDSQEEVEKEIAAHKDETLFLFSGPTSSALWEAYNKVAEELHLQVSFTALEKDAFPEHASASLRVFKDGADFPFEPQSDSDGLQEEIRRWVMLERHPAFQQISALGIRRMVAEINLASPAQILSLVVFVLNPDKADESSRRLKTIGSSLASDRSDPLLQRFRFVWCSDVDSLSRLVMTTLHPPNLVVYGPEDTFALYPRYDSPQELRDLTAVEVRNFLTSVAAGEVRTYGGSGFFARLKRACYEFTSGVLDIVQNSPMLALLVFGFPLGCLSCLCYCICWGSFEDDPEAMELRARSRRFELPHQFPAEEQREAEMTKEDDDFRTSESLTGDAYWRRRSPANTTFLGPVPSQNTIASRRNAYMESKKKL